MLKALILDFNGVIIDDEPLHFRAMRKAVAEYGVDLSREAYWSKYLPMDDEMCLDAICRDYSVTITEAERRRGLELKSQHYIGLLKGGYPLFQGVSGFIKRAAAHFPLAIASGARRDEIESTLESTGLRRYFVVIAAAEDFTRGKPHPESFLLALERLNRAANASIRPEECLVIEDSIGSVRGAMAAGMKCLAVTNSYPPEMLREATGTVTSLEEVQLDNLLMLFKDPV